MASIGIRSGRIKTIPHLYFHIPFCSSKCHYCGFYSQLNHSEQLQNEFLEGLKREIDFYQRSYHLTPETIYIGGGNPSLVPNLIKNLFSYLRKTIDFNLTKEITIECNPIYVTEEFLSMFRFCGINRVSVGVQSFCESSIQKINRSNQTNEIVSSALERLEKEKIDFSIDLISGLPDFRAETELRLLDDCINRYSYLNHISIYSLSIDPGSYFYHHQPILPKEDQIAAYEQSLSLLLKKNGFKQYEISNWCRKEKESQHNKGYWLYEDYLGFGPAAHSKVGNLRIENQSDIELYLQENYRREELLTSTQQLEEILLMGLRLKEGISWERLKKISSERQYEVMVRFVETGRYQSHFHLSSSHLAVTESGWDHLNRILVELFILID